MYASTFHANYQEMLREGRAYKKSIERVPTTKKQRRRRQWALSRLHTKSITQTPGDWANRTPRSFVRARWRTAMKAIKAL